MEQIKDEERTNCVQETKGDTNNKCKYSICKPKGLKNLERSWKENIWSIPLRKDPPHPIQVINQAFKVISSPHPRSIINLMEGRQSYLHSFCQWD